MNDITVIYDANVLYPVYQRSSLLFLSLTYLFKTRWTYQIHEEWIRNVLKNHPNETRSKLEYIRDMMIEAIDDSIINNFEHHIDTIEDWPDQNDRHVVAAAIEAKANFIVTWNFKHFPNNKLERYKIKAITPDDFITLHLYQNNPRQVLEAFREDKDHYKKPPFTSIEDYLSKLKLPKTLTLLKDIL